MWGQQEQPIWEAEESLWLGGRLAYAALMAPDCLMAFPQIGVLGPDEVLHSLDKTPRWQEVRMSERQQAGGGETCVLAYRAEARRDRGDGRYRALCTSSWRRDGGMWKLIQHHQTPL